VVLGDLEKIKDRWTFTRKMKGERYIYRYPDDLRGLAALKAEQEMKKWGMSVDCWILPDGAAFLGEWAEDDEFLPGEPY
jgi:hypothetical protein